MFLCTRTHVISRGGLPELKAQIPMTVDLQGHAMKGGTHRRSWDRSLHIAALEPVLRSAWNTPPPHFDITAQRDPTPETDVSRGYNDVTSVGQEMMADIAPFDLRQL